MPSFRVRWEIDIDAENAQQAAMDVHEIMVDPDNIAKRFNIFNHETGDIVNIDLLEDLWFPHGDK